jgi:hypothetical protein
MGSKYIKLQSINTEAAMKFISFTCVKYILLFSMIVSTLLFQSRPEKIVHSSGTSVSLSQTEMGNIIGGDVAISIYAPGDVVYWMVAGAAVGFLFAGTGGILPGIFYGGLLGWIFG